MKYFLIALCVISVAALPTAASANSESEAVSTKPIVIAYIPEHLQQRIPGHQHKEKFEVQYVSSSPEEAEDPAAKQRRRALGFGIGLGLGIPLLMGAAIATAMSLNSISQIGE